MIKNISLLFLMCTVLACAAMGQSRYFLFNRYSVENGLGSNRVYCTSQDERGFVWVGGSDGIMRFDGAKFVNYTDWAGRMPSAAVTCIVQLSKTKLMLCFTDLKEVGIFDIASLQYTKVPFAEPGLVHPRSSIQIVQCGADIFMVYTGSPVLMKYDTAQQQFSPFTKFNLPEGWNVYSLYYDTVKKNCWFSCDSGLAVYSNAHGLTFSRNYNPHQWKILEEKKINDGNWSFFIDSKRRHWILNWPSYARGSEFLYCYDAVQQQFLNDTAGWKSAGKKYREIKNLKETKGGIVWAYGLNGLLSRMPETERFENNKDDHTDNFGIKYETVHDVMEDRDGGIWISTDQGLYFAPPSNDKVINLYSSIAAPFTGMQQLSDGRILINTWGDGTKTLEIKNFNASIKDLYPPAGKNYSGLTHTWCSYQHPVTKKIYIGAQSGWLGIYNPADGSMQKIQDSAFDRRAIIGIAPMANGDLLFSTQAGRVVKLHNCRFEVLFNCGTIIYALVTDEQNNAWLATHNKGIYKIDAASGNELLHVQNTGTQGGAISSNIVTHLQLAKNNLLLAANGKLSVIDTRTGNIKNIGLADGLPSNTIQAMHTDSKGDVWLATSNGLCRYSIADKLFTRFGSKDGIADATILEGASLRLQNNMLLFAGKDGKLLLFLPDALNSSNHPADVAITDIKLGSVYYPIDSLLALPEIATGYNNNFISIGFSSLNFLQSDKELYYYKMEGLESDWKMINSGALKATYSYLPPGHYTFKVWAKNIHGFSSKNITQIKFYIRPPFWRSFWFISTCLFYIAILIYTLHRMQVNKLLAVEKIRTRVARDLHDDMGSTLSTINILSAMAKSKLNTDAVKTSEYIGKISENSQRMMEAMDDIVWSIKPLNDSMQRMVARMREIATNVLEAKDIEVQFIIQDKVYDVKLNMEARRDFFLIFKEAVNNAAKYSRATHVIIKMEAAPGTLLLDVKDDGCGFDTKKTSSGNGMGNMQKRAEALQAKLIVQSQPGVGTAIKMTMPVK